MAARIAVVGSGYVGTVVAGWHAHVGQTWFEGLGRAAPPFVR